MPKDVTPPKNAFTPSDEELKVVTSSDVGEQTSPTGKPAEEEAETETEESTEEAEI